MAKTKKICIKCISEELKQVLIVAGLAGLDYKTQEIVDTIPLCPDDTLIEFELKKTRKPSAYSQFIGQCIKDTRQDNKMPVSEAMKGCAIKWKQQKSN